MDFPHPLKISNLQYYEKFSIYTDKLHSLGVLGNVYLDFSSLDTAKKRFMYTHDLLRKHSMLPKALVSYEYLFQSPFGDMHRLEGNNAFRDKNYIGAINSYTMCLKYYESGQLFAIALGNRSAAFYILNLYEYSLNDIHRALKNGYPAKLLYKLYCRAGNIERLHGNGDLAKKYYTECLKNLNACHTIMSEERKSVYKIKVLSDIEKCEGLVEQRIPRNRRQNIVHSLLGGKNENIPALSAFLELKLTDDMERGVFATCDIQPGDVVAIDTPYICGPISEYNYICNYTDCLKINLGTIPCPNCCVVFYCNEDCMQKANEDGHRFQCSIMKSIRTLPGIPQINDLVIKSFFKEFCKMGLEKYCSIVNKFYENEIDPKTRGFDENGQYKSDSLFTVYSLECHENKVSIDITFFLNCLAVEMLQYMMISGFYIKDCDVATIGVSFVRMLNILDLNCWKNNINSPAICLPSNKEITKKSGDALYPSICLFNHSCSPNVIRCGVLHDRIRVMKAVQLIPKGNQLFVSYGVEFQGHSKEIRTACCSNILYFDCKCPPCLKNWPMDRFIPKRLSAFNVFDPKMADTLSSECLKFINFKKTATLEDCDRNIRYLYSFAKFLLSNVKRPFELYEDCVSMICKAHIVVDNGDLNDHLNLDDELLITSVFI